MSVSMIILVVSVVLIVCGAMFKVPALMLLGFAGVGVDIVLIGLVETGALPNWTF